MPTVNIPDIGVVNFPDSMSFEDISTAIREHIIPQATRPPAAAVEAAPPPPPVEKPYFPLGAGIRQTQALGYSGLEGLARAIGLEELADWAKRGVDTNLAEAAERLRPDQQQTFRDANTPMDYVKATTQALASTALPTAVGIGGGLIGGTLLGGPMGALAGAVAGGTAAALPLTYGQHRETQKEVNPGQPVNEGAAILAAVPAALADAVVNRFMLGIGKAAGVSAAEVGAALLPRVAKGIGVGAVSEVPAEVFQEVLDRAQSGQALLSPDAMAAYKESAMAAAAVGGVTGGGAAAAFGKRPAAPAAPGTRGEDAELRGALEALPDTQPPPPPEPPELTVTLPADRFNVAGEDTGRGINTADAPLKVWLEKYVAAQYPTELAAAEANALAAHQTATGDPTAALSPEALNTARQNFAINLADTLLTTEIAAAPARKKAAALQTATDAVTMAEKNLAALEATPKTGNIVEQLTHNGVVAKAKETLANAVDAKTAVETTLADEAASALKAKTDAEALRVKTADRRHARLDRKEQKLLDAQAKADAALLTEAGGETVGALRRFDADTLAASDKGPSKTWEVIFAGNLASNETNENLPLSTTPERDAGTGFVSQVTTPPPLNLAERMNANKTENLGVNAGIAADDVRLKAERTVRDAEETRLAAEGEAATDRLNAEVTAAETAVRVAREEETKAKAEKARADAARVLAAEEKTRNDAALLEAARRTSVSEAPLVPSQEDVFAQNTEDNQIRDAQDVANQKVADAEAKLLSLLEATRGVQSSTRGASPAAPPGAGTAQTTTSAADPALAAAEAAARTARRDKALAVINDRLEKMRARGAQGATIAANLEAELARGVLTPAELYVAFQASSSLAIQLPAGANHDIMFVPRILANEVSAEALAASGGAGQPTLPATRRAPTALARGLIKLSLEPQFASFMQENAAHEAFHVVQDYIASYDPSAVRQLTRDFRDGMTLANVEGTLRRKLELARMPSGESYWASLQKNFGANTFSSGEMQALVFGALADANRRGVPMTGLKPSYTRLVLALRQFFQRLGGALRADGFTNAADMLNLIGEGSARRFDTRAAPLGAGGAQASARRAPPALDFRTDVPNEGWLQSKINYAKSRGLDKFGVGYHGKITGYFRDGQAYAKVSDLVGLPGQNGEQQNVRQEDLAAIRKIIRDTGELPLMDNGKEYAPFLMVDYAGNVTVSEGNHRIMAAAAEGLKTVPIEIRYFDGGERTITGPLSPGVLAAPLGAGEAQASARRAALGAQTTQDINAQAFHDMVHGTQPKPGWSDAILSTLLGRLPGEGAGASIVRTSISRAASLHNLHTMASGNGYTGRDAGTAMELAMMNTGRIQQAFTAGMAHHNPTTGSTTIRRDIKPLLNIFKDNDVTVANKKIFHGYAVARQERDLRKTGRVGFLQATDQQIRDVIAKEEAAHPKWATAVNELQQFNEGLLDFAIATGVLDKAKADGMRMAFYTPLYRVMDADNRANPTRMASTAIGASFRDVSSALDKERKGGERPINDLFENIIGNADSIIRAGLKNVAAKQAADTLVFAKLGEVNTTGQRDANTITYRVDGNDVDFNVNDPVLFSTLATMPHEIRHGIYTAMAGTARIFRDFVTSMPSFIIKSLYQGKGAAYVQEGQSIFTNTLGGFRDALNASTSLQDFQMQTGFGGNTFGQGDKNMARGFARQLTDKGMFKAIASGRLISALRQGFGTLQAWSEAAEMAERLKLSENLKKRGASDVDAAYGGYLLAPYSRRGTGEGWLGSSLQFLIPLVPFLNAKLQTTYRLIENEKGDKRSIWTLGLPQQIFLRGLVVTAFSLMAYSLNVAGDDEEYNETPDYLKLAYDIIPLPGGGRITLPRFYEVGGIFGALPVFMLDAIRRGESKDLVDALVTVGLNTFWMNPTPKAVAPIVEMYANLNFFQGRPIESKADQGLPVGERANRDTSYTARGLAGAVNTVFGEVLSPAKAQALIAGYTGILGATLMSGLDSILAAAGAVPTKPSSAFGSPAVDALAKVLGVGSIYRDHENYSKSLDEYYKIKEVVDQLVRSQNRAKEFHDFPRLQELAGDAGLPLRLKVVVNNAATQMEAINKQIARHERSDADPGYRRDAIRVLSDRRTAIARRVVEQAKAIGAF